ncbi:MAG: hypothetical protein IKQ46_04535, partial [Bacteroidales bacterium]|nr:hypothetical protein [Bacteroidales bacterium]
AKEVMKFDRMSKEEQNAYIRHLDAVANEKEAILTAKIWGKIEGRAEGEKIGIEKGEKIGIEKGEKIGIEKGESQKALAIAKNLKAMGVMTIEQIAAATNLDAETIEKL